MTYKEKIEKLQEYLLEPKKAIEDKISYFDSLHDILMIEEKKGYNELTRDVYNLYWAVFDFFLEAYEIERLHVYIPLKTKEDVKLIHTEYFDKNMNLFWKKSIPETRFKWEKLEYESKKKKCVACYFDVPSLSFQVKFSEIETDEYKLESEFRYHYHIDKAVGFDISAYYGEEAKLLNIDRWKYLAKGFSSYELNFNRHSLKQEFDSCHSPMSIRLFEANQQDSRNIQYAPLREICNTYNRIGFKILEKINFEDYIDKLREKHLTPKELKLDADMIVEESNFTIGKLNPQQAKLFYDVCMERMIDKPCSFQDFVENFGSRKNITTNKIKIAQKNLFYVVVYFWKNIFEIDIKSCDEFNNSIGISLDDISKKKIDNKIGMLTKNQKYVYETLLNIIP